MTIRNKIVHETFILAQLFQKFTTMCEVHRDVHQSPPPVPVLRT